MGTQGSKRSAEPVERGDEKDVGGRASAAQDGSRQKKRGWREVEAWRERKFLRESLAEIWDEEPDIDESLIKGDESDAAFYTDSEDIEVEDGPEDFEDESYYEDED